MRHNWRHSPGCRRTRPHTAFGPWDRRTGPHRTLARPRRPHRSPRSSWHHSPGRRRYHHRTRDPSHTDSLPASRFAHHCRPCRTHRSWRCRSEGRRSSRHIESCPLDKHSCPRCRSCPLRRRDRSRHNDFRCSADRCNLRRMPQGLRSNLALWPCTPPDRTLGQRRRPCRTRHSWSGSPARRDTRPHSPAARRSSLPAARSPPARRRFRCSLQPGRATAEAPPTPIASRRSAV